MHSQLMYGAVAHMLSLLILAKLLANGARALPNPGTDTEDPTNDVLAGMCHSDRNPKVQAIGDRRVRPQGRMPNPAIAYMSKGSAVFPLEDLRAF